MPLNQKNPTLTDSWKKLKEHFNLITKQRIEDHFKTNKNRGKEFSTNFNEIHFDYSKNKINSETINLFNELLMEINFSESVKSYFEGDKINDTESRSVLHTALRAKETDEIFVDGVNIMHVVTQSRKKMMDFSDKVISGSYKGMDDAKITDIVNIGIGGSDLGPSMVCESLSHYKTRLNVHFVNNVDGDQIHEVLKRLTPTRTLFIIVSKTFTTIETITNAKVAKEWFQSNAKKSDISKNFVGVSSNTKAAKEFGIHDSNIFPMWDWVGGRFSLWGSVGLAINLSIGSKNFNDLLIGANEMDDHFKSEPISKNIPLLAACITIWYNNFYNYETHAVIPYNQNMKSFSAYLQQASMESNGKQTSRNGEIIDYQSGSIIWGQVGTNAQHSFFQLLHQGTKIIPCDFIGFSNPLSNNIKSHQILMANFFAQTKALMMGKKDDNVHKHFGGNRPTNTILINKLTPKNLGSLIALYEHKIFSVGVILNLFSFDQFGVELGKKLANDILKNIEDKSSKNSDSSTENLLKKFFNSI